VKAFQKRLRGMVHGRAGMREIWLIAYPLIVSTASGTVMMFADRMFLSHYSKEALAAATPAGITHFMCVSLFIGITGYVNSMVAQHYGAQRHGTCGAIAWQGLYVSAAGSAGLLLAAPFVASLFAWAGHAAEVIMLEITYFRILIFGSLFFLGANTLSSFFSGIGQNRIVMLAHVCGMFLNVPLSFGLIFGVARLRIPPLGIAGAGYGTIMAQFLILTILFAEFLRERYAVYRVRSGYPLHRALLLRLIRFGGPSGVELLLSIAAFNVFLLLLGSLGTNELAAVNLTLSWDVIAFLPQIGLGVAVAAVTGKYVGAKDYVSATRAPYIGLIISFAYASIFVFLFLALPSRLVSVFGGSGAGDGFHDVRTLSVTLLRLAALYVLADAARAIFAGALRGAGDTRFLMWSAVVLHWCFLAIPGAFLIRRHLLGVIGAWIWFILFLVFMAIVLIVRFRNDKWKRIDVLGQGLV
jgi:MATE family multidrug resistance protein